VSVMKDKEQFETVGGGLLVRAPAKVNLSLLIAGKRPDGFHELETLMAKITWYDEIFIEPGQKIGVELVCRGQHWAPEGEKNLVYQAAKLLLNNYDLKTNIKVTLTKNIPAGSGLGSASSDAAATLMGLNKFLDIQLSNQRLAEMASQLGSDVTFFLNGPLAFCTGKGEKIKKIDEIFDFLVLLALPDVSVSTKKVYANYTHEQSLYEHLSAQINGYLGKNRIDLIVNMCANMLEESAFNLVKKLAGLKAEIELFGIGPCCLSGSGSTIFCLIESGDEEIARQYKHKLEKIGCKSIIASSNRW
jgi:4-diphosphocytidyl-2-C-methyl-D-erythritol kinase